MRSHRVTMADLDKLPHDLRYKIYAVAGGRDHPDDGCWLWDGAQTEKGYGRFSCRRSHPLHKHGPRVHRIVWKLLVSPVVGDLENVCQFSHCCNPNHWEERK